MLMSNCNFKPLSDINYLTFFVRTKPMLLPMLMLVTLAVVVIANMQSKHQGVGH